MTQCQWRNPEEYVQIKAGQSMTQTKEEIITKPYVHSRDVLKLHFKRWPWKRRPNGKETYMPNIWCIFIAWSRFTWWRHQMETFSALLAICAGNSPVPGQWRGALMFSLICVWLNGWVNNREAGDLRRYRAHYDVIVMNMIHLSQILPIDIRYVVSIVSSTCHYKYSDIDCLFTGLLKIATKKPSKPHYRPFVSGNHGVLVDSP